MRTTTKRAAAAVLGALALAACGGGEDDAATAPAGDASTTASAGDASETASAGDAVLTTADSDLGEIVVDADGRTVYVFDRDVPGSGSSSCSGGCLESWPPVVADADPPGVDGVSGEVGTIERDDGTRQVTLGGLPLYTYVGDSDAGKVTGQGVQDVWWVVTPDGAKVTEAAPSSTESGY